jgi:hypothetical protein
MQQGDIDGVIALFERIKQIDPVSGFSSLINARQFPDDVKTLERMEKVATQPRSFIDTQKNKLTLNSHLLG